MTKDKCFEPHTPTKSSMPKGSGEMNMSTMKGMSEDKFCSGTTGEVGEGITTKKISHKNFKGKGGH